MKDLNLRYLPEDIQIIFIKYLKEAFNNSFKEVCRCIAEWELYAANFLPFNCGGISNHGKRQAEKT